MSASCLADSIHVGENAIMIPYLRFRPTYLIHKVNHVRPELGKTTGIVKGNAESAGL